ncbi:hypothetical protein CspHIS471_0510940 [Cutaneotrichosporon sp. HIS471]|nr:hypothetical protein CspHIS471_0510940 [Cutaneotrichosporon sp. HIS471]
MDDDGDMSDGGADGAKRPRLRLAHACDRCRKRKIRCDTQQPCGPCSATKNECTFNTPSRRVAKPKPSSRSSSATGLKRPHSPSRGSSSYQASLEARLATLESLLRDVPPNVHNAYLSTLDARLASGQGGGIVQGRGEGTSVGAEALLGGGTAIGASSFSPNFGLKPDAPFTPSWSTNTTMAGAWAGGRGLRRRDERAMDDMARRMENLSFFYEDEIGQAKWQGATSGFPLLEMLTAEQAGGDDEEEDGSSPASTVEVRPTRAGPSPPHRVGRVDRRASSVGGGRSHSKARSSSAHSARRERFFPDRNPRPHQTLNPEASWKVITGVIPPDLMDTLVRCYLSTSHLLWPFLHVPSFLADYANPQQWGEPGFACFIVAVCTLSSRHVDDPRVRANPADPSTAGKQYFELFKRLRDLPSADRPTLYSIQAAFLAAIYAFGLGNLSKAFALQAESVTLCLDGGLHRSVDAYDHFNAVERETRKRTFWSIYAWDKQSAALFGRPPIIHLRDCDVDEPLIIDDDNLTVDGAKEQPNPETSRLCAFVAAIRLHIVLEGVIDSSVQASVFPTSSFLARASSVISHRAPLSDSLRDEEVLLEEWTSILPNYWKYDSETANSRDPIRITQAERLHCLEHLVKMIIYRHRFSGFVLQPAATVEDRACHLEWCKRAMQCALTIIADHVHISQRGMMTYYGVHVIHQLAQAGRTLVAVILNCKNPEFRPLISPSIEGLRSCVGLLRRFSGRYLCGLRSADIIDEFCRVCNIPVDSPRVPDSAGRPSPAWLRPVRKRASLSPAPSHLRSLRVAEDLPFIGQNQDMLSTHPELSTGVVPTDLESLFNTSEYFDISAMDVTSPARNSGIGATPASLNPFGLGEPSAPFDRLETLSPNENLGGIPTVFQQQRHLQQAQAQALLNSQALNGSTSAMEGIQLNGTPNGGLGNGDLTGDTKSSHGLSAATILSLLEEGTFDYGSIFTDQAPLGDFTFSTDVIAENGPHSTAANGMSLPIGKRPFSRNTACERTRYARSIYLWTLSQWDENRADIEPAYFFPLNNNSKKSMECEPEPIPDDLIVMPEDDPGALAGIPVFKPTYDEFKDFDVYMERVAPWGQRSSIVKIIPPKEWVDAVNLISPREMSELQIRSPIEQQMLGKNGVFIQRNIERNRNRPLSVKEWFNKCSHDDFLTPDPRQGDRTVDRDSKDARAWQRERVAAIKAGKLAKREAALKRKQKRDAKKAEEQAAADCANPDSSSFRTPPRSQNSDDDVPGLENSSNTSNSDGEPIATPELSSPANRSSRREPEAKLSPVDPFYETVDFKKDWLPAGATQDDFTVSGCANIEKKFWKSIGMARSSWYGADLAGSLFADPQTPWNVAHLPNLLQRIKDRLPGVNTPYLYFGMWRAAFSWHVEDMDLFSINYIHFGAPKFWYAVPQADADRFETVTRSYFSNDANGCDQFMRHKSCTLSPTKLAQEGIRVNKLVHYQNEFVITFPRGYHAGFNMGFNCAESVNFALPYWLEIGKKAKACTCVNFSVRIDVDRLLHSPSPTPDAEAKIEEVPKRPRKRKSTDAPTPRQPRARRRRTETSSARPSVAPSEESPVRVKVEEPAPRPKLPVIRLRIPQQFLDLSRQDKPKSSITRETPKPPCVLCPSLATDDLAPVYQPSDAIRALSATPGVNAHVSCAIAVPEAYTEDVDVGDGSTATYIRGLDDIGKDRWKLKCAHCVDKRSATTGTKIQCTKGKCLRAYHIPCARNNPQVSYWAGERLVNGVLSFGVELLCPTHNPAVVEMKKRMAQDELRRKVLELRGGATIKIKASGGSYEATLVGVNEANSTVLVQVADGTRRPMPWTALDFHARQPRMLENEYAGPPKRSRKEQQHPPTPVSVSPVAQIRGHQASVSPVAQIRAHPLPTPAMTHAPFMPHPHSPVAHTRPQSHSPAAHPRLHSHSPVAHTRVSHHSVSPIAHPRVINHGYAEPPPHVLHQPHYVPPSPAHFYPQGPTYAPVTNVMLVDSKGGRVPPHMGYPPAGYHHCAPGPGNYGPGPAMVEHARGVHPYLAYPPRMPIPAPGRVMAQSYGARPLLHAPPPPHLMTSAPMGHQAQSNGAPGGWNRGYPTPNRSPAGRPPPALPPVAPGGVGKIDLGLDRMRELMRGLPPMTVPAVHLAGTNGKGSVSALLESCFRAAGFRTARYNSPHLLEARDAVRINGLPPSREQYAEALAQVERTGKERKLEPTTFEVATAAFFYLASTVQPPVDVMIVECGMGGARDATNVMPDQIILASGLTSVGLDHTDRLGNTIADIAREKASILVQGAVLVTSPNLHPEATSVAHAIAAERGAHFVQAAPSAMLAPQGALSLLPFREPAPSQIRTPLAGTAAKHLDTSLGLGGAHQLDNLSLVLTLLDVMRHDRRAVSIQPRLSQITEAHMVAGVANTRWEGRCSWLAWRDGDVTVPILADGAHNADSAATLRAYIDGLNLPDRPRTFVLSLSANPGKTPQSVLAPLLRPGDRVALVDFTTPVDGMPWIRPADKSAVRAAAEALQAGEIVDIPGAGPQAVANALRWAQGDWNARGPGLTVVCGSLYLVADAYRLIGA